MELEEIKTAVKNLSVEERRKVAMYILELEKQHMEGTIGPHVVEGLDSLSRAFQDTVEKIKKHVKENIGDAKKS